MKWRCCLLSVVFIFCIDFKHRSSPGVDAALENFFQVFFWSTDGQWRNPSSKGNGFKGSPLEWMMFGITFSAALPGFLKDPAALREKSPSSPALPLTHSQRVKIIPLQRGNKSADCSF